MQSSPCSKRNWHLDLSFQSGFGESFLCPLSLFSGSGNYLTVESHAHSMIRGNKCMTGHSHSLHPTNWLMLRYSVSTIKTDLPSYRNGNNYEILEINKLSLIVCLLHSFFLSFRDIIIQQCKNLHLILLLELQLKAQEFFHLIWAKGELSKSSFFSK